MRESDLLLTVAASQEGVDRVPLDGAGTDEGDLDREVVEGLGLHPGQRRHLRARLHLEHTHGVGLREHRVDGRLLGDPGEIDPHPVGVVDEIHRQVEGVEHPETEQVELHDAHRGAVVLVPLDDRTILHAAPLHGDHLPQRPVGDDHPAGVDAEVPGEAVEPPAGVDDEIRGEPRGQLHLLGDGVDLPGVEVLREAVDLRLGEPECLADVLEHRPGPVGDHVGDHRGALAAVAPVAVLDHLLAALGLEVDVDVGRATALV
jgi:hypothetical protein